MIDLNQIFGEIYWDFHKRQMKWMRREAMLNRIKKKLGYRYL